MTLHSTIRKPRKARRLLVSVALGLMVSGCGGMPQNRLMDSIHQPVVSRDNYTIDLTTGPDGISIPEQRRLASWFETMQLHYGDRVALDDPLASQGTRAAVEAVAARFGILVSTEVPVTAGYVNAGTARVILTRTTASVPHCPDWSANSETNWNNATSSNYGCAVNSNLAAMIANPEDLMRGADSAGETSVMTSDKAIETYRSAKPTGGGNTVKQTSSKD